MLWSSLLALASVAVAVSVPATYDDSTKKSSSAAPTVTFSNARRLLFDSAGQQIDAYGSKVQFFNGSYWLYGNSFNTTGSAYGINAYRSANLVDWKNQGNILDANATAYCRTVNGRCGRPHLLVDPQTGLFNLWINGGSTGYLISTGRTPAGPFTISGRATTDPAFDSLVQADFAVETIGSASYLVFSALNFRYPDAGSLWPPIQQTLHISQVTDNNTNTTGVSYPVTSAANDLIDQEAESPDIFKRGDWFYVATSTTCGYCNGSIALMYRSKSIKGPWTRQIIAADGCQSQFEGVLQLTDPSTGNINYVWHGTSGPNPLRIGWGGHIFQPLTFNSDGSVADLNCAADATFTVPYTPGSPPVTIGAALKAGDQTPANAVYSPDCGLDSFSYIQTWTASKTGTLKSVSVNVARGSQTVPLSLTVFNFTSYAQLTQPGYKYGTLGSATFNASQLGYTFGQATVATTSGIHVTKGQLLGVQVSGADFSPWCVLSYNTTGNNAGGFRQFVQGNGQNSWRGLAGKRSVVYERFGSSIKVLANYA